MNKLKAILLFSLASQLPLTKPLSAASNTQDLSGIFDGGAADKISAQSLFQAYGSPLPPQSERIPEPSNNRKFLYQILAEQEETGEKKFYSPQEIADMICKDYGDEPSEEEKRQIKKALDILKSTKFGTEMCKAVAYDCTMESLEKAGISLRVKKFTYGANQSASGLVPPPLYYAGRTFIGLGKNAVSETAYSEDLALAMLHEMSHVQDLRKNKIGTLEKAKYASEEKALMNEISAYDEISRKSGYRNNLYSFLIDVWAWKNESSPYPKHRLLTLPLGPKGKERIISTEDLLNNYMPGLTFWDSMERLVYSLWHSAYGAPKVNKDLVEAIRKAAWEKSEVYKTWRKNPAGPTQPAATPTPATPAPKPPNPPKPPQEDDENSYPGGGTPGSGDFNPGQYNPHFPDGI